MLFILLILFAYECFIIEFIQIVGFYSEGVVLPNCSTDFISVAFDSNSGMYDIVIWVIAK